MTLLACLLLSLVLCGVYRALALKLQLLDHPNERSSHSTAIPHGGGVGLFVAWFVLLLWYPDLRAPLPPGVLLLTAGLVLLGILDDLLQLSVRLRFALYALASIAAAALLLAPGGAFGVALTALAGLCLLWGLNLYNFMDGTDGLAAAQCIAACGAAALLGSDAEYARLCLLLAAAQLGFLAWNWPPAKLFMGDAGSIATGFLLGCLALQGALQQWLPLGSWLILLALFITDSSYTLLWRLRRSERITQAHRSHAYQRLARHWGGHLPVLGLFAAVFLLWLLPLAAAAANWSGLQFFWVILAYIPLLAGMAKVTRIA